MFKKPTLTDIIKRDLANALELAHDHSKAAEHHEALMVMFSDRAERLQGRLDAEGNQDSKAFQNSSTFSVPVPRRPNQPDPQTAEHFPKAFIRALAKDFVANGPKP